MTDDSPLSIAMKNKSFDALRGGIATIHYSCTVWTLSRSIPFPSFEVVDKAPFGTTIIGKVGLIKNLPMSQGDQEKNKLKGTKKKINYKSRKKNKLPEPPK